ncbi:MAG: Gfo/Idh/MocA family oxidoreductase [Desulfobacterales bacterium]|jgi:predicted dehydrogenase
MAEAVKWGVMGNATIARKCVIPAIGKSHNGRLHALATRSPAEAAQVVTDHQIDHVYDTYEALLDDPQVDLVYIPLPNHLHHPWTIKALEAGKHVLCEKPLASNAKEAREMAAAAKDAERLLMEAFMYRFHPRSLRIKQLIAEGAIGTPRLIRSAFCFRMADSEWSDPPNVRLNPEMGGGALLDVGCYSVSVARWFLGAEPTQVQAQAEYDPGGVDVHMVGTLGFADHGLASFEASFVTALQQTYSILGSDGAIDLPHNAFVPWENEAVFYVRESDQAAGQKHIVPGADEYQLMVEHFADAVMEQTPLMFSTADSIENMRVLDALAQAARTGEMVRL